MRKLSSVLACIFDSLLYLLLSYLLALCFALKAALMYFCGYLKMTPVSFS